jgi:putative tryptophan/tyrosine transport system substrate-binding protein
MHCYRIKRSEFITLLGGAALGWPLAVHSQQPVLRRFGVLMAVAADDPEAKAELAGLHAGLARLGWIEGSTIHIDYRFAASNPDRFPLLAKELLALNPEVILTQSTEVTAALQQATRSIPIIFVQVSDPVGSGFVASLPRPGGNLTGVIHYEPGITGKWLAMLKEIAPSLARVAVLANPKTTPYDYFLRNAVAAAPLLAIELIPTPVDNVAELEQSISGIARQGNGGLLVLPGGFTIAHRDRVIALAAEHRLPAVYPWRYFVMDGGLMSYGINVVDLFQQSASYVDRILRGAKPADLPVQVPTRYETVVNLKTAKALGLVVPPGLLVAADEVIE